MRVRALLASSIFASALALGTAVASASSLDIYNSAGFESPSYTTGQFTGQSNAAGGSWNAYGVVGTPVGTSANVVQGPAPTGTPGATDASGAGWYGNQSVQVNYLQGSNHNSGSTVNYSDGDSFFAPISFNGGGAISSSAFATVTTPNMMANAVGGNYGIISSFDMKVVAGTGQQGFGEQLYDSTNGQGQNIIGGVLVGSNGEIYALDGRNGVQTTFGSNVNNGLLDTEKSLSTVAGANPTGYNYFQVVALYNTGTYGILVNGVPVETGVPFFSVANGSIGSEQYFTDADLTAVNLDGGTGGTGTAYFDNYDVSYVPVPKSVWSGLALVGVLAVGKYFRRQRGLVL